MSHNLPRSKIIYHVDNIDCTKEGTIEIMTLGRQKFYPSETILEVISSNALSGVPTISIGASPLMINIIDERTLTGLLNANNMETIFGGTGSSIACGSRVMFKVVKPATGGSTVSYILRCILIGTLI